MHLINDHKDAIKLIDAHMKLNPTTTDLHRCGLTNYINYVRG